MMFTNVRDVRLAYPAMLYRYHGAAPRKWHTRLPIFDNGQSDYERISILIFLVLVNQILESVEDFRDLIDQLLGIRDEQLAVSAGPNHEFVISSLNLD
jgi:hypothetical protein